MLLCSDAIRIAEISLQEAEKTRSTRVRSKDKLCQLGMIGRIEPFGHSKAKVKETAAHGMQMFGFGADPDDVPPPTEPEHGFIQTARMVDCNCHAGTREFLGDCGECLADDQLFVLHGHDHHDLRQVHTSLDPRAVELVSEGGAVLVQKRNDKRLNGVIFPACKQRHLILRPKPR
jgi:hypothetical protein